MRTQGAKDLKPRKRHTKRPVWTADYDLMNNGVMKEYKPAPAWHALLKPALWFIVGFAVAYFVL